MNRFLTTLAVAVLSAGLGLFAALPPEQAGAATLAMSACNTTVR